jgi:hemolysin D
MKTTAMNTAMTAAQAAPQFDVRALDFAPDLLAIQERPPSRLPRAIALSTVALTGLMIVWASFAKLDIVATAEGRLVPVTYTKVVQPAESGVVQQVLVQDGDVVRAGQVLVRLDARLNAADSSALGREAAQRRMTLKRIEAELADASLLNLKHDAADGALAAQVQAQFITRRQAYADAVAQDTAALARAQAELAAAEQVRQKLEQVVPLAQQAAQAHQKLLKEGFIGELAANEKQREALEKEQDLRAQRSTVDSLKASVDQAQRKLESTRSGYRSQLQAERMENLALLNRSAQELDKSQMRQAQMEVRAPTDGVVKDLAAVNPGQVVQAGALLMNLVPKDEQLQAEVQLKNEDVGFVVPGQEVSLKIAAFPFQKYGLLSAEVALVSADAQDPRQATAQGQQPTLSYKALVGFKNKQSALSRGKPNYSTDSGKPLVLAPGMLVMAEIKQGQRTVMEYLLSPVQRVGHEAARER